MQDSKKFAAHLRKISKPKLIVANKIDLPGADKNFDRLREKYVDTIIIPASADSELSLRRAEGKGLIKYVPGSEQFEILHKEKLSKKQVEALDFITKGILGEYMRTGVQFAINVTVFKLLKMNSIYIVAITEKIADNIRRILVEIILLYDDYHIEYLVLEI